MSSNFKFRFIANFVLLILASLFVFSCTQNDYSKNLVWVFKAPRDIPWSGYGGANTPVEAGDYIVYIGGYFWQNQVYLYVVNKKTGKLVWKNEDSTYQFKATDSKVVITTRESILKNNPGKSKISKIICYDLKTGEQLWLRNLSITNTKPTLFPLGSGVYIWIPGKELFCLDLNTGEQLWRQVVKPGDNLMANSTVTTDGDKVYVAQPGLAIALMDGKEGKFVIAQSIQNLLPKSYFPKLQLIENKLVLFGSTGFLTILDLKTGKFIFNKKIGIIKQYLALDKGKIYFGMEKGKARYDEDGEYALMCYDLSSKKEVWQKGFQKTHFSRVSVGEKNVFFGDKDSDQNLYALSKKDGSISWQQTIGPIQGNPIYKDGTLYVCGKEFFYALDSLSGAIKWKLKPIEYEPASSPLVTQDNVFFVGKDANLYCTKPVSRAKKSKVKVLNKTDKTSKSSVKTKEQAK